MISSGNDVELLHLTDGTISAVHAGMNLLARLTTAGLFYSYTTDDWNYPSRVVFIPSTELAMWARRAWR